MQVMRWKTARGSGPWGAAGVLALALAGCANPAGIAPQARALSPAEVGLPAATAGPALDVAWWRAFGDETLDALVAQALAGHPDLGVARARVARAAAGVEAADAGARPQVGGSLDLTRQRYTENGAVPQPLAGSTRSSGTLQLAGGWELDFFGRYRAQLRAALGAQLAAQAELAAARVLLAAEVARQYVQLARLVALRHVAEQGLAQRQAMLELIRQRVAAGAPLMAVVPLSQVWVDANFKESQLRRLRIGQSVTLTADVYGDGVTFHGTVAGLGAGTGAAFSLLPAQNATGNWIKVVQRVPVRIALDATELAEHPLRVGLSMEARVDVRRQDGRALADGVRETSAVRTEVFGDLEREAQARIDRIIATHLGRAAPAPARS